MASPPSSALATQPVASLRLEVRSPDDLQRLARLFSASGLFGRGNPETHLAECAIKILAGMEAGFGAFASISGVTVINGKPGFGANLLAQAIKRHPIYDYRVLEKTEQTCRIRFLAGREELGIETFTIQMANRAGLLADKPDRRGMNPWKAYPEAMLFARCLTAGTRTHCPDALGGVSAYTPEELGATGQIDENGTVVAVEVLPPTRDELQARAISNLKHQGLTEHGMAALLADLGGPEVTGIGQLSDEFLQVLADRGAKAESIARWNATPDPDPEPADEDLEPTDDEPPYRWSEPTTTPTAA